MAIQPHYHVRIRTNLGEEGGGKKGKAAVFIYLIKVTEKGKIMYDQGSDVPSGNGNTRATLSMPIARTHQRIDNATKKKRKEMTWMVITT